MRQKVQEMMDAIFGFRKFIAFVSILLAAVAFRIASLVNGAEFVDLMKSVTVSFFAVNGIEHFTTMAKDYMAGKQEGGKDA